MFVFSDQDLYVQDGFYVWFCFVIFIFLSIIGGVGLWVVVIVLFVVQIEFGIDCVDVFLFFIVMMVGFVVGNFFFGCFVDQYGIVWLVIVLVFFFSVGFVFVVVLLGIWSFLFVQGFLIGFGMFVIFGLLVVDVFYWFLKWCGLVVVCVVCGNYLVGVFWLLFV